MNGRSQSRKWQLTINNPETVGLSREDILEKLNCFNLRYYCIGDEIGESGNYHTHVFMFSESPIRFGTIKGRFPIAHIEKAYGTVNDNRNYVLKEGKWKNTKKSETTIEGTFFEYGEIPTENEEKAPEMMRLIYMIKEGYSIPEIIEELPKLALRTRNIEELKKEFKKKIFKEQYRNVRTSYICVDSVNRRLDFIYERHGFNNVCRITNYRTSRGISFDNYDGEDVIIFDNFNGQIPLDELNNYLDRYPLMLPSRYEDRVACFTRVYIVSSNPLSYQYIKYQTTDKEEWDKFVNKIDDLIEIDRHGVIEIILGSLD